LEINIRYNHKNALAIKKINRSERKPKVNIFIVSRNEKDACVIG
jgi:hypothetical protein